MKLPENSFEIKTLVTKNFLNDLINLMVGSVVINHSYVTGDIIGYAHDFCNRKLKENQRTIPVIARNLFSFDFFFVVKGIWLCVWRTKNIAIGSSNLTNVQYANIGTQVKFIDTIKYYQQSLASLAANVDDTDKQNIRTSCQKFILRRPNYAQSFANLSDEEKNWVLDYLCGGKGVLPYEAIRSHEDLDRAPGEKFFAQTKFYSSLKNAVKKLWKLLRLEKLSDLNDLYNFQDTIILCEIFENRASEMMYNFPINRTNLARSAAVFTNICLRFLFLYQQKQNILAFSKRC